MSNYEDELPDGFFAPKDEPPGVGRIARVADDEVDPLDHFIGWGIALNRALANVQGSRGKFRKNVKFSATVSVENPGIIIEYISTMEP